jgi:hypothetical protein
VTHTHRPPLPHGTGVFHDCPPARPTRPYKAPHGLAPCVTPSPTAGRLTGAPVRHSVASRHD